MEKRQVQIMAIITAICLLGDSMLYVVLPTHWKEIGLASLWEVGILLSVNRFIRLPMNPVISWLFMKLSRRTGIILAIVLTIMTTSSYGLFSSFWILVLMRCLWGVAWSFLRIGSYLMITDLSTDENRGHYMGTFNGLYRLGSLFGMVIGGIFADLAGLYMVSLVFAGAALCALPLVFLLSDPARGYVPQVGRAHTLQVFKNPPVLGVLTTGLFLNMLFQGLFVAVLSHLIDTRYPMITIVGLTLGAATLAGIMQGIRWGWEPILAPVFGKVSDGMGRKKALTIALFITSVIFALVPLQVPMVLWLIILLGVQMSATLITTVIDALALDMAKKEWKGAVTTSYIIATDLGSAIGPTLGYFLLASIGLESMYWGAAALLLVVSIIWWSVRDTKKASVPMAQ
ncbi:MFS transporter [Ammoniphilus sp. CFH 90114]|uniref:MFS transporter n=1 Tax=Ammoniphilus sp. CFH 90114 TaxID=2493665 RepID=UPI00100E3447|nr:MFS transporter [Ammoniphilus sp. CFH 90114]RXT03740.1 MFS transporter [Ammoniphilus sp. CFH 90114]